MALRLGTLHFESLSAAARYYRPYGEDLEAVKLAISEGRIAVGPPPCKPDEQAVLDRDGQYFLEVRKEACQVTEQPATVANGPGLRKEGGRMKISDHILAVLANAITDGRELKLQGSLDRKVYQEVNKVLEANGGKWNRSAQAHVFDEPAAEAIEQALMTGEFQLVKQDLGQFDTPDAVADRVAAIANLSPDVWLYEPSCGVGNLISAAIRAGVPPGRIWANEFDVKRLEVCRSRHFAAFGAGGLGNRDFLQIEPGDDPAFDRILMNPPFAKQADIDHVMHARRFLSPGGRLVSVMSASAVWREDRKSREFRDFVKAQGGEFEPLAEGAFRESGTAVKAVICSFNF